MSLLAVDIGGTRAKWGVIDSEGVLTERGEWASPDTPDLVAVSVAACWRASGADELAVAVCGAVEETSQVVLRAGYIGVNAAPFALGDRIADMCGRRPSVLVNDADATAVGESRVGAPDRLATLWFGSGVGARLASDGHLLALPSKSAGSGHMPFRAGGRVCMCGQRGCVEAYVGWVGIRSAWDSQDPRPLSGPGALMELADAGDQRACVFLEDACSAAAQVAAAIATDWAPDTLRIGGGVAAAFAPVLLERVSAATAGVPCPVPVQVSELGDDAALLGLAAFVRARRDRSFTAGHVPC